jgi:hypothetical protein
MPGAHPEVLRRVDVDCSRCGLDSGRAEATDGANVPDGEFGREPRPGGQFDLQVNRLVWPDPIQLMRGLGPMTVSRLSSRVTFVCSTPRRSMGLLLLLGDTVTTVSVRSLAMTSIRPTCTLMARSMGVGVVNVGMLAPSFLWV